jgi:ABC-type dipeptide/oligopeptide/nickel transport system ATPase component
VLELRLTRRYSEVVALDDLSFTVRGGQMFGFVRPNGAGKTIAMRIILGLLNPSARSAGAADHDGRDAQTSRISARGPGAVARRTAMGRRPGGARPRVRPAACSQAVSSEPVPAAPPSFSTSIMRSNRATAGGVSPPSSSTHW